MLVHNEKVRSVDRDDIMDFFKDNGMSIDKRKNFSSQKFDFKLLGLGFGYGVNHEKPAQVEIAIRVNYLEHLVLNSIDDSKYFLVFDELDEDYKGTILQDQHHKYAALLTSLFKAVQDIKSIFKDQETKLFPVVLLRDDIFDKLEDPDRTKWLDLSLELNWTQEQLKRLIAFRISKAKSPDFKPLSFDDAWGSIFRAHSIEDNEGKASIFTFISNRTHMRPRDFVEFIKVCAEEAVNYEVPVIDNLLIKSAEHKFSRYLRSEIEDEMHSILPEIKRVFDLFSTLSKKEFRLREFKNKYKSICGKTLSDEKIAIVLEKLFIFNVIGTKRNDGNVIFKCKNSNTIFNPKLAFVLHRGLHSVLNLTD
jgi:hypothetical protein